MESGDGRYVDLSPARGDDSRQGLRSSLMRKQAGRPLHIVFSSHRGAGKTTELKRLVQEIAPKFHTLYVEANVEMDPVSIDMEDLLLVLARSVHDEMNRLGLPLDESMLKGVNDWFSSVIATTSAGRTYIAEVKTSAEAGASAAFTRLVGNVTSLFRLESNHRTEVKEVLRKYPGALMAAVNKVFDGAHKALKTSHRKELLIIIDNLDRYDPAVLEKLLVAQVDHFKDLQCNLILTPPIAMLCRPGAGRVGDYFTQEVMCTVKLREREDLPSVVKGEGYTLLLEALARRIDIDRMLPDEAARRRLILASGGSVRDLLKLSAEASLRIDQGPITSEAVERVVSRHRARMRDEVNTNRGWRESLRNIFQTQLVSEADADLDVLYHRLAFKYNGTYWYDVHPLVAEFMELSERPSSPSGQ